MLTVLKSTVATRVPCVIKEEITLFEDGAYMNLTKRMRVCSIFYWKNLRDYGGARLDIVA